MYCEQCGAELEPSARFCSTCGTGVTSEEHNTSVPSSSMRRKALAAAVLGGIVVFGGILFWASLSNRSDLVLDAQGTRGVALNSKELTRDIAARMLLEHEGYPKPVEGNIREKSFYTYREGLRNPEKELEQRGVIKTRHDCTRLGPSWNSCDVMIALTDEGKKYFIGTRDYGSTKEMVVKACEETFLRVTGILPVQHGFTGTIVEYEITYDNPTPFSSLNDRSCRDSLGKPTSRTATFGLYDDGWRIQ